jgi:hypothetical protein
MEKPPATKNLGGRPPFPGEKREQLVQFYVTKVHYEKLKTYASQAKLRGVSTFLTALVEPIIEGRMQIAAAVRSITRLQTAMEKNGHKFLFNARIVIDSTRDMFAPPAPIPDDVEDISRLIADLESLVAELKTQQTNTTK